jgi:23S rRNA (uracil1939-C5)-methyltransferase
VVERLDIETLGHRGDGIAAGESGPLYVPYALPGETVEVEAWPGHPDRRHLIRVETASAERIAPVCPHFGTCGGCALQHWATDRYREWKRGLVAEALAQARLDAAVDPLVDAHGEGRRRAVFHAWRRTHDVIEVGFAALRAHHLVPIDRCPVLAPSLEGAIPAAWAIAETLGAMRKPLDIQVTATESGLDVDVRGSGPIDAAGISELARLAQRHRLARLTRHGELVTGDDGARPRRAAARRLPAGHRHRRSGPRGARPGALRQGKNHRRSLHRRRTFCVAARRARQDHRVR